MKPIFAVVAAALLVAACDRPTQPKTAPAPSAPASTPAQPLPQSSASGPSAPNMEQKKEGANPQQGQVDPKDVAQHRDFQQRGDSAGPTSPETTPKSH